MDWFSFLFGVAITGSAAILIAVAWAGSGVNRVEELMCQTAGCRNEARLEGVDAGGDPVYLCAACADVWLGVEP